MKFYGKLRAAFEAQLSAIKKQAKKQTAFIQFKLI